MATNDVFQTRIRLQIGELMLQIISLNIGVEERDAKIAELGTELASLKAASALPETPPETVQ